MIDIHSHILPMVDDGASSVRMALALLDQAYRGGTDTIILTPHLAYAYNFINPYGKIRELFEDFKRIVQREGIPIKMYLGTEFLFSSPRTFYQHQKEITTMNQTKYLLMEFFFDVREEQVLEAVDTVAGAGYIPIIAHPERFECFQIAPHLAKQVIKKGALLQMNKGSILSRHGSYAKETVIELLENHYISFVGSDAHHPQYRDANMHETYDVVCEYFGQRYADEIFYKNPEKMIQDIDIRKKEKYE